MNDNIMIRISKRMSLHLRHAPERIGIELGPGGWVDVDTFLSALGEHGFRVSRAELDDVVARNDKRRFAFDHSGTRIRASQGHSVEVNLELPVTDPPAVLFHGTAERFLPQIESAGLRPMGRHHVHMSAEMDTAIKVGARHGRPVVLTVDAAAMVAAGHLFHVSANGVWLTDTVPATYLAKLPPR
jgi:putative RNA 2'-phosphotransferase